MAGNSEGILRSRKDLGDQVLSFAESEVRMGNIRMSEEEYLLYLRAHREMVQRCFFSCFDKNGSGIRSQKEIMDEMRDKIRIAIPMEPSCDAILEEIVLRLLDHYDVQGILTLVPSGTGYQLLGMQKELG